MGGVRGDGLSWVVILRISGGLNRQTDLACKKNEFLKRARVRSKNYISFSRTASMMCKL